MLTRSDFLGATNGRDTRATPIDLAIFDMDGVLFHGRSFWVDLHHEYGTKVAGERLTDAYLHDYPKLARFVAGRLWKGRSAIVYRALVESRAYQPGVSEVFKYLTSKGVRTAILTSGPDLLASRAQAELGVDAYRANGLGVDTRTDTLTGAATIRVPDAEKARVARELIAECRTTPGRTAFVGDSAPDAPVARLVGLSIAYDPQSEDLAREADYVVPFGELTRVIDILRR
jgi:phosphoserine phosphatase